MVRLKELGWDERFESALKNAPDADGCRPARVIEKHRRAYTVLAEDGEHLAQCRRTLLRESAEGALPALGDWVAIKALPGAAKAAIHAVLERKSAFSRKKAGEEVVEQVIAANIDVVFIVAALGQDFNPRRLERYLAVAWEGGAGPVILLNKSDLRPSHSEELRQAKTLSPDVPVHVISAKTGEGIDSVRSYLASGVTGAFLGSSGAGKSSIINNLLGSEIQKVAEVRAHDERGKHTTTSGKLLMLPSGGVLVDTAGMRELQLWATDEGLDQVFQEIDEAAAGCKFRDCAHDTEPGCAVRKGVEEGSIAAERLSSYLKLRRELDHLAEKQDLQLQAQRRQKRKGRRIEP